MTLAKTIALISLAATLAGPTLAASHSDNMMAAGLMMPEMNAAEGRKLFVSKGCVVCHSINGVGGTHAPMMDVEFMDTPMNPFEFAARMWRGAEAMIELQRDELGDVIDLDGEELAAIIAFAHDADEQADFSEDEIPEMIQAMMGHMVDDHAHSNDAHDEDEDAHDEDEDAHEEDDDAHHEDDGHSHSD